jgi:beta-galactosidase
VARHFSVFFRKRMGATALLGWVFLPHVLACGTSGGEPGAPTSTSGQGGSARTNLPDGNVGIGLETGSEGRIVVGDPDGSLIDVGVRDSAIVDASVADTRPDIGPDVGASVPTTDRSKVQLRDGWRFLGSDTLTGAEAVAFDDSAWPTVSVPHTWDSVTATSNRIASHSRAWYRAHFALTAADLHKRFYAYFEGAFQVADVYVNGRHLGQHRGGYTRFIFDATPAVAAGDNVLAVQVSNADCADCLPDGNGRLMKGYGGIYRKAWLVTTNPYHVATTDFASTGVYVSPSNISGSSAEVSTRILLTNDGTADQTFTVKSVIRDAAGSAVLSSTSDVPVRAGATAPATHTGTVTAPHLWGPTNPYLYDVLVTVSVDGTLTDAVNEHIGFRSYQLTTTDFTLNGVSTRLRGVAKHQETEYHASAVSDEELVADWDNLQDLGVNFARLVHYPHAQLEYDLADQRGIMVWAENGHTNGGAPTPNGDQISREMVYQNWNHPSIVFWSAGNEAAGVAASSQYASVLGATGSSRPVVYASNGQNPTGVDFIFHNTYAGWYGGTMYDFLTAADRWISETGAGMVTTTHTADAFAMNHTVDSFEPEDYGALVNEVRFDDLFRNPGHVPAFAGWVFRDISDVKYKGLLNTKGLVTFAGYKKDVFYHLKSFLRTSSVVHLVAPHYFLRSADAANQGPIKVYSNASTLTLTINGTQVGSPSSNGYTHPNGTPIRNVFYWPNVLRLGKNIVTVTAPDGTSDSMTVYYRGAGTTLPIDTGAKVQNLTSSVGQAYFIDTPIAAQRPFYFDFDSTGDNTFDVVPPVLAGASFIATRRQSDAAKRTDLAFDLPAGADVFIMFTRQASVPSWITAAGFADSGVTGQWRDNSVKLVDYLLYRRTFASGAHVALATSAIDYVVLIK